MRVLFIGGTGNISTACVEQALADGHDVTLLNRGTREPSFSRSVRSVVCDRNDRAALARVAREGRFDVVADFIAMLPDQVAGAVQAFAGQTAQYLFISTASAYQKPPTHYLVSEDTPLGNPYWDYSRLKIAAEQTLRSAAHEAGMPYTIVRPSYTFGPTWIPAGVGGHGYTIVGRMRRGQPIIAHGDGTSLWVMTYHTDFAAGFVGLFGRREALGEDFHITSDQVLTWNQIYQTIAAEAGCQADLVHIPSETIAQLQPEWGPGLLGDKMHSVVFDNSKIKRVVPGFQARISFGEGIRRSLAWHAADPARQHIDESTSARMDALISTFRSLHSATQRQGG